MKKLICTTSVILILLTSSSIAVQKNGFFYPKSPQLDLIPILTKPSYTTADYEIILEQTGIYKPLIDELKDSADFLETMLMFQQNYYAPIEITKTKMSFFTSWDKVFNDNGDWIPAFTLAPYQNGYIFLTKSTYTANWRHGHAGIVVDAQNSLVMESLEPGTSSILQPANRWEYYPTFKMMRPIQIEPNMLADIATHTLGTLSGIPYNILATKKLPPTATQCALLIWQAYIPFMDIDANKGIFVSPPDIAKSTFLEPVQIFGYDPNKPW